VKRLAFAEGLVACPAGSARVCWVPLELPRGFPAFRSDGDWLVARVTILSYRVGSRQAFIAKRRVQERVPPRHPEDHASRPHLGVGWARIDDVPPRHADGQGPAGRVGGVEEHVVARPRCACHHRSTSDAGICFRWGANRPHRTVSPGPKW